MQTLQYGWGHWDLVQRKLTEHEDLLYDAFIHTLSEADIYRRVEILMRYIQKEYNAILEKKENLRKQIEVLDFLEGNMCVDTPGIDYRDRESHSEHRQSNM